MILWMWFESQIFHRRISLWSLILENFTEINCLLCDLTALLFGRRHYGSLFFSSCFSFENKHT